MNYVPRAKKSQKGLAGMKTDNIRVLLKSVGVSHTGKRKELCDRVLLHPDKLFFDGENIIAIPPERPFPSEIDPIDIDSLKEPLHNFPSSKNTHNPETYRPKPSRRSITESFPLEDLFTRPIAKEPFYDDERKLTYLREEAIGVLKGLRQPFPLDFGLTKEGLPTPDLRAFSGSRKFSRAMLRLMHVVGDVSNGSEILQVLGIDTSDDAIYPIYFDAVYGDQIFDLDFSAHPQMTPDRVMELVEIYKEVTVCRSDRSVPQLLIPIGDLENKIKIDMLKRRVLGGAKTARLIIFFRYGNRSDGHVSQVIINLKALEGWYIESSIPSMEIHSDISRSIEFFVRTWIGLDYCRIAILDFDRCPTMSLQENSPTCAGWTFYLFLLSIMNPELVEYDIVMMLSRYDRYSRDLLITLFYYYFNHVYDNIIVSEKQVTSFMNSVSAYLPRFTA